MEALYTAILQDVVDSDVIRAMSRRHSGEIFDTAVTNVTAKLAEANIKVPDSLNDDLTEEFNNSDFYQCELTGATLHVDDTISITYGNRNHDTAIVSSGLDTFECNDCSNNFLSRPHLGSALRQYGTDHYETENGSVCRLCYEDNYQSCNDCGESYCNDNMRYHEGNEESYCEGCYPTGLDTLHNRLILPRAANSSVDGLAIGWEIEFYPSDHASPPSSQHVERIYHDGSLTSEGREITTQPALPDQWLARLNALEDVLGAGYIEADCGGHLHVDARYLHSVLWKTRETEEELKQEINYLDRAICNLGSIYFTNRYNSQIADLQKCLAEATLKLQDFSKQNKLKQLHTATVYYQNALRLLCNRARNESTYAQPQTTIEPNYDKYMAVNISGLHPRAERQTVEFRLWDGCINTMDLYRRAEVCEAIVRKMTQVAEWLTSSDELAQQKARQFLENKSANNLQTSQGFWDLFNDGKGSFAELQAMATELQLSNEWREWAKAEIIKRKPERALAA